MDSFHYWWILPHISLNWYFFCWENMDHLGLVKSLMQLIFVLSGAKTKILNSIGWNSTAGNKPLTFCKCRTNILKVDTQNLQTICIRKNKKKTNVECTPTENITFTFSISPLRYSDRWMRCDLKIARHSSASWVRIKSSGLLPSSSSRLKSAPRFNRTLKNSNSKLGRNITIKYAKAHTKVRLNRRLGIIRY